jgi:hypothetical protein
MFIPYPVCIIRNIPYGAMMCDVTESHVIEFMVYAADLAKIDTAREKAQKMLEEIAAGTLKKEPPHSRDFSRLRLH